MKKVDFKVVILGSDINAYYMSRNFHEEYGIKPHLMVKTPMLFTSLSKIVTHELVPGLWEKDKFLEALISYGEKHIGEKIIFFSNMLFTIAY